MKASITRNGQAVKRRSGLGAALRRHRRGSPTAVRLRPIGSRIRALGEILGEIHPVPEEWLIQRKADSGDVELVTVRMSDVASQEVRWLWDKRLAAGKLNIIHGDPGAGKTFMVLDVLSHVTTGKKFCDGARCECGEVLFVTAEDGIADTIRPRLDLLGADVDRAHCLDLVRVEGKDVALNLDEHLAALRSWLGTHPEVTVMALDPLAAFLGKINAHQNNEVRAVLGQLAKLAEQTGVTVLAIDHLAKSLGKAMYRGIGSIAFTAAPRAVWQVLADPDDPGRKLFLPVKCNLAKVDGLAFRLGDTGITWEDSKVTISADEVGADAGSTPRSEAKTWLRDFLSNGPMPAREVARQAREDGICERTLKYAKKELNVASVRTGGAWSWTYANKVSQEGKARGRKDGRP